MLNFIQGVLTIVAIVYIVLGAFATGIYISAMILNNKYDDMITPKSEIARTAVLTFIAWPMLVYYMILEGDPDE